MAPADDRGEIHFQVVAALISNANPASGVPNSMPNQINELGMKPTPARLPLVHCFAVRLKISARTEGSGVRG